MPSSNTLEFRASHSLPNTFSGAQVRLAQSLAQVAVIPLICISILAPFVSFSPALPSFRVEVVLLPLILVIYGSLMLLGYVRRFSWNGMFFVGAVYVICVSISTWYGAAFLGQTLTHQDFYELPKVFLPVAFFTLTYEANLTEIGLRRLMKALGVSLLLICLYAWAQWLDLGFSQQLSGFYTAGKHVDDALVYARRVYSTMGNPNVLGELLTWSSAAFLLAIILRAGNRTFAITVTLACLVTLGMTGSRYGLLNTALAFLLVIFMPHARRRRPSQRLLPFVLLPLCIAAIILVAVNNPRTLERFQTLRNPLATDSATERYDKLWLDAIDDLVKSPIVGRGPAKSLYAGIVSDSEYLDVLKEFGVVGLVAFLAYYLFPLALIWRGMRIARRAEPAQEEKLAANYLAMRLAFVMIVTAMVMNVGMSTFYNQLVQAFLWMWMGLGARAAKTIGEATLARPRMIATEHPA